MNGRIELWHDDTMVRSYVWKDLKHRKELINHFKKLTEKSWLNCYMIIQYSKTSFDYAADKRKDKRDRRTKHDSKSIVQGSGLQKEYPFNVPEKVRA